MSENQWWEILLSELTTVRIVCRRKGSVDCGRTAECRAVIVIPLNSAENGTPCRKRDTMSYSASER
jgi:hypothetical protein